MKAKEIMRLELSFAEGDPTNYLTYFKRGTVYLALGKAKFALLDFHKVLELKPDFHSVSGRSDYELNIIPGENLRNIFFLISGETSTWLIANETSRNRQV